jgi:uncharacterized protein
MLDQMDILSKTSGTLVNVLTVIVGTLLGLLVSGRLSDRTNRTLLQVLSLVTASIGLGMAAEPATSRLVRFQESFWPWFR